MTSLRRLLPLFALPLVLAAETPLTRENAWAFPAADDPADAGSALDLRALLGPGEAGAEGFVRLSADRESFVDGTGRPLRFWAVVSEGYKLPPEKMERHAAWLARRGVNLVRIHADITNSREGAAITDVNPRVVDGIQRWVSVAKRHGIYTMVSPYWAHTKAPKSWGLEGYENEQPWGLLFFNPALQDAYRAWCRALYTTPNPHADGLPLKDDPALAFVQLQNEDSLLFWTFNGIKAPQRRLLGAKFHAWALARHGDLASALRAWDNTDAEGDDLAAGVLGFRNLWELTGEAPAQSYSAGHRRRLADQLEFLVTTQRDFHASIEHYLKRELGVRSLTNASNWRSADQVLLDDAERHTYGVMDLVAVNYYSGGAHVGENDGYRIDPGHRYTNASVFRGTAPHPANLKQPAGHPVAVTETAWVHPNLYQSEGPFLMAAYPSLTGVDITCWFDFPGPGHPEWMGDSLARFWPVGDSHAAWKWYGNHPMLAGQFPAFALAFRLGLIKPADRAAVHEERTLADLWERRVPLISESGRFDPNRDVGGFAPESPIRQEIDRAAFFVGPVVVRHGGDPARNQVVPLENFIDRVTGDVRSLTGELLINQRRGFATINAPAVRGVSGFLASAGGDFPLGAARWRSRDDYATLVAVALDGLPLEQSRRVLVQAGTVARLTGFSTAPDTLKRQGNEIPALRVVHNGEPPLLVRRTAATLTLRNPHLARATRLDPALRRAGPAGLAREDDTLTLTLPEDALYTLLEP